MRSTSAFADAGTAGSPEATSGQEMVPTAAPSPAAAPPPACWFAPLPGVAVACARPPPAVAPPAAFSAHGASASRPAGLVPLRPMAMAMRSMVEIRLSLRGPRMALLTKLGPPWPTVFFSRVSASWIWVLRRVRLRSTSAFADAGTAGSLEATSGQEMVPGSVRVRAFWAPPPLAGCPARAVPAITAPESATAAAPPMIATRRLLYFGSALDMRLPHLGRGWSSNTAAPVLGGGYGKAIAAVQPDRRLTNHAEFCILMHGNAAVSVRIPPSVSL